MTLEPVPLFHLGDHNFQNLDVNQDGIVVAIPSRHDKTNLFVCGLHPSRGRRSRPGGLSRVRVAGGADARPPARCDSEQWRRFEGPAKAWWRAGIESGQIAEPDLAWYAASCVISPLEQGRIGRPDWDWNVLTGYDLTFDSLGHAGLMFGWTAAEICQAMMSFLRFLGEREVIDRGHVSRLLGELETWGPRLERYFHQGGPWFLADGTPCS